MARRLRRGWRRALLRTAQGLALGVVFTTMTGVGLILHLSSS